MIHNEEYSSRDHHAPPKVLEMDLVQQTSGSCVGDGLLYRCAGALLKVQQGFKGEQDEVDDNTCASSSTGSTVSNGGCDIPRA